MVFINIYIMVLVSHLLSFLCIIYVEYLSMYHFHRHDLGALKVARKIQVIDSLQVDKLFTTGLWT